jgi:hypothetical protein
LLKIQKKDDNRRGLVHLIKGNSHLIAGKKVIAKLDIIIGKKKKEKKNWKYRSEKVLGHNHRV